VLSKCLTESLALLHPFMPFITEEIWDKATGRPGTLIVSPYPLGNPSHTDPEAERVIEALRALVTRVRNFRTDRGVPPTEPAELWISEDSPEPDLPAKLRGLEGLLRHLARLSDVAFGSPPDGVFRDVVAGAAIGLRVAERSSGPGTERLTKTLTDLDDEIGGLRAKLQNTAYLDKAPAEVVEKSRRKLVELEKRRADLSSSHR